jgi:hypothetical protein
VPVSSNVPLVAHRSGIQQPTAAAFTPTSIAGLDGWFKADSLALADGAAVGSWTDSSENANHAVQSTAAAKPTYKTGILNGKPVVRFDGGDTLESPLQSNAKPGTLFVVVTPTLSGVYLSMVSGASAQAFLLRINPGSVMELVSSGTALIATDSTTQAVEGTVIAVTYSATGAYAFYTNGAAGASGTNNVALVASNVQIGSDAGGLPFVGDIAEILFYDSVLSASDRGSVTSYLGTKYGITVA